eukprot:753474-Hanusia_phi.AAC.1
MLEAAAAIPNHPISPPATTSDTCSRMSSPQHPLLHAHVMPPQRYPAKADQASPAGEVEYAGHRCEPESEQESSRRRREKNGAVFSLVVRVQYLHKRPRPRSVPGRKRVPWGSN